MKDTRKQNKKILALERNKNISSTLSVVIAFSERI